MKRFLILFLVCFPFWSAHAQKGKNQKRDVKTVEQELTQARDSLRQALDRCLILSGQLEQLDTLRKWAVRSMLHEYGQYPSVPFGQVNPDIMDSLRYMGTHLSMPDIDRFLAELDTLERHREIYQAGWNVLEQDYDSVALDSISALIGGIMPNCPQAQQEELEDILKRIRIYPTAIKRAKIVAEWMADTLKDLRSERGSADTAVGLARSIFRDQDPEYKDYISKIPYMDRLYNDYMKAILETPLQAGPEEAKLLGYE